MALVNLNAFSRALVLGAAVAVLALLGGADAYSTGSPRCDLDSMLAMSSSPQRNPNLSWSVEAVPERDVANGTGAGPDLFRVSIVASDPAATFKGFLLFAEAGNGQRTGQWLNIAESRAQTVAHPDCNQGHTLTHFDSADKASGLVFHYRAPIPTNASDLIKIRCGVVRSVEEWYVARPVVLRPNMQAAAQYVNVTGPAGAAVNQSITPAPIAL